MLDDALEEIQVKLAFLEKQVADLDDVVREIGDAMAEMRHAIERIAAKNGTGDAKPDDDDADA